MYLKREGLNLSNFRKRQVFGVAKLKTGLTCHGNGKEGSGLSLF